MNDRSESKQKLEDRQIRVFISSTFQDMQAERDHLVKFVFPELRRLCESRGVTWGEVDLRWGVTDEQKAEGKVLPLCLEEIKRCRPYFIGLLGERYGWIPEAVPPDLLEREPWLREQFQGRKSVTELEILHGVLRDEAMHGQAFFYFRDPAYLERLPPGRHRADFESEGLEARAKLTQLKQSIRHAREEAVCRLREDYRDPQQLGEWLLEDFTQLINELFPEGSRPDPLTGEALDHAAYARSRQRGLYRTAGVFRPARCSCRREWGPAAGHPGGVWLGQVGAAGQLGGRLPAGASRRLHAGTLHWRDAP